MAKRKEEINIEKMLNFIEEFSWLLENYRGLKIADSAEAIKKIVSNDEKIALTEAIDEIEDKEKRELVGIFPELFQNRTLFSSNQSIIEFSNEVLRTDINPSKNRSKNEIIGEIVCTTYSLKKCEMEKVVSALEKMVNNDKIVKDVKKMKEESSFSWNEIIQKLAE